LLFLLLQLLVPCCNEPWRLLLLLLLLLHSYAIVAAAPSATAATDMLPLLLLPCTILLSLLVATIGGCCSHCYYQCCCSCCAAAYHNPLPTSLGAYHNSLPQLWCTHLPTSMAYSTTPHDQMSAMRGLYFPLLSSTSGAMYVRVPTWEQGQSWQRFLVSKLRPSRWTTQAQLPSIMLLERLCIKNGSFQRTHSFLSVCI
jgi:hypothetical protein